jgi:protein-tyrosine-phosphatase
MNNRVAILVCLFFSLCSSGWSRVIVHWSAPTIPAAKQLGMSDVVIWWSDSAGPLLKESRKQGYRVYVESQLAQANAAAQGGNENGATGVILSVPLSQGTELESALPRLQSAYPKLRFLVLNAEGKLPQMRGSLVIKHDSVLEVSSPTAQPWIDTNLALVKIEQRAVSQQAPLYTFSWARSYVGQEQRNPTEADYSLAVAEAGAFHASLLLDLDEHLQAALNANEASAWKLWRQVVNYADFYSTQKTEQRLEPAANVAVVVDDLDPGDEVMNLMARHNIPFKVLRSADLKSKDHKEFDVVVVFSKPDQQSAQRISDLAILGTTVVLVEAQAAYPWHNGEAVRLNEHAASYALGKGKVIELAEPVSDPETFSQDIRRLLGKDHTLISVWNGLTTIAVPYGAHGRGVEEIEFINYAADPLRVQVQVKGSFRAVRYESPERGCCDSLAPVAHGDSTEFVIPELQIAGRVHLVAADNSGSQ